MGYSRAFCHACAVAAIAGLAFPASAKVGRAYSDAEKDALLEAWISCIVKNAVAVDDGTTPADAIGRVIAPACRTEAHRVADSYGPFRSERSRQMFLERRRASEGDDAAVIVLQLRAERKKVG